MTQISFDFIFMRAASTNTSRNGTEILIRLEKSQPVTITSWYEYLLFMMHHDKKSRRGVTPVIYIGRGVDTIII